MASNVRVLNNSFVSEEDIVLRLSYSTADVERATFIGESSDPLEVFAEETAPVSAAEPGQPITLLVVSGEMYELRPGVGEEGLAFTPESSLFGLADLSEE